MSIISSRGWLFSYSLNEIVNSANNFLMGNCIYLGTISRGKVLINQ
jgi:hypothetical protein